MTNKFIIDHETKVIEFQATLREFFPAAVAELKLNEGHFQRENSHCLGTLSVNLYALRKQIEAVETLLVEEAFDPDAVKWGHSTVIEQIHRAQASPE